MSMGGKIVGELLHDIRLNLGTIFLVQSLSSMMPHTTLQGSLVLYPSRPEW